jgi:hypothetical protein
VVLQFGIGNASDLRAKAKVNSSLAQDENGFLRKFKIFTYPQLSRKMHGPALKYRLLNLESLMNRFKLRTIRGLYLLGYLDLSTSVLYPA